MKMVRARQDARVSKAPHDAMARIDKAENTFLKARGLLIRTDENISAALYAIAQGVR
jgi:hypothetical protein